MSDDLALRVDGLFVEARSPRGGAQMVVRDVSLQLSRGEAVGVVGESGSGKSLTLRAMLGIMPRSCRVAGGRVDRADSDRVAMIFQEPLTALNPTRSVGALIADALRNRGRLSAVERRQRVLALLTEVGIPEPERRSKAYPHQLSGGQRQRVMIAMALATEPAVLLCDEPTTALDVTVQDQVLALLESLRESRGLSIVFVSHDLAVVQRISSRIYVMLDGRVVEEGESRDLFLRPQHQYTRQLIAASVFVSGAEAGPLLEAPN